MSIEQAIHERWAAHAPLTALVPPERVVTGQALGQFDLADGPYVLVIDQGEAIEGSTASGTEYAERVLRFSVYADSLDSAKQVRTAIKGLFNRSDFDAHDDGRCMLMQRAGGREVHADDGTWHVYHDYRCLIEGTQT